MKITFFGTSHGVPEVGRRCSSALIEVGDNRYFIDMGTQAIEGLIDRRIPVDSIKCIFITHMHGDHNNGLISFLDLCSWKFKTASPKVFIPNDPERAKSVIEAWLTCNGGKMRPIEFCGVSEGVIYDDGALRLTAIRTKHIDFSYAYLVEAEGNRVLFSGDLCHKGPAEDFPLWVLDKPLDLAICESAHFPATDYLPLLQGKENLKMLCFTHYTERFLESVLVTKRLMSPIPVTRATDGMEIVL